MSEKARLGSLLMVLAQGFVLDTRGEACCGGAGVGRRLDAARGDCSFRGTDLDIEIDKSSGVVKTS